MKIFILITSTIFFTKVVSQDSIKNIQENPLNISLYSDVYFAHDKPIGDGKFRQPFLYNFNRRNSIQSNLTFIKANFRKSKFRTNLALHAGTYSTDNYSNEPGFLKHLLEANIGFQLNTSKQLWLDVGVMPSHIGFESAIAKDNKTVTRSILAENSPYFSTGLKLSFQPQQQLKVGFLLLNGWQRIYQPQNSLLPSFGTSVEYNPTSAYSFNWNTFLGSNDPDSSRRWRFFQNFYLNHNFSSKFCFILGFDIGMQQQYKGSIKFDTWLSPVGIVQFALSEKLRLATRYEYYRDSNGAQIAFINNNSINAHAYSINIDYDINLNFSVRAEYRKLFNKTSIFDDGFNTSRHYENGVFTLAYYIPSIHLIQKRF